MKRLSLKTRLSIYTIGISTLVVVVALSLISIALKDLVPEEHYENVLRNIVLVGVIAVVLLYSAFIFTIEHIIHPEYKHQASYEIETQIARGILQSLQPTSLTDHPKAVIETATLPSRIICGDFYNYVIDNDILHFIMADVAERGVASAIMMAILTKQFSVLAKETNDPAEIISKMNAQLCKDNHSGMFVALTVGVIDLNSGVMKICNAGHRMPYIVKEGKAETLEIPKNVTIGVLDDYEFQAEEITLTSGAQILLYSDGVVESKNFKHEPYGKQRLEAVASRATALQDVVLDVTTFMGAHPQSDDISMITISLK
ncbi:MAG: serine/threonine-protein phosphatase [Bacteroidaceae bacterium]|nr:serine/threonine-protein phosphatase [Bacteroidaceae bacterium]